MSKVSYLNKYKGLELLGSKMDFLVILREFLSIIYKIDKNRPKSFIILEYNLIFDVNKFLERNILGSKSIFKKILDKNYGLVYVKIVFG